MTLKLKRLAPLQAGKMLAALYGLLSLVIVPIIVGFMSLAALVTPRGGAAPLPFMFGMGMGFVVFVPVFYAAMGFAFGVIGAFIYNWIAGWLGGFEMEFEPASTPSVI